MKFTKERRDQKGLGKAGLPPFLVPTHAPLPLAQHNTTQQQTMKIIAAFALLASANAFAPAPRAIVESTSSFLVSIIVSWVM